LPARKWPNCQPFLAVAQPGKVGKMELFAAIDWSGIANVITAIGVLASIVLAYLSKQAALRAELSANRSEVKTEAVHTDIGHVKDNVSDLRSEVGVVKEDVHKVEMSTNSMKDALVAATKEAALSAGELKGRADKAAEVKAENKEAKAEAKAEAKIDADPDTVTVERDEHGNYESKSKPKG